MRLDALDILRLAVCAEGALVLGQSLYIFSLVRQGLTHGPSSHIYLVALSHICAILFMLGEVIGRFKDPHLTWATPTAAVIFGLTHAAMWQMIHALHGRRKPKPIPPELRDG